MLKLNSPEAIVEYVEAEFAVVKLEYPELILERWGFDLEDIRPDYSFSPTGPLPRSVTPWSIVRRVGGT